MVAIIFIQRRKSATLSGFVRAWSPPPCFLSHRLEFQFRVVLKETSPSPLSLFVLTFHLLFNVGRAYCQLESACSAFPFMLPAFTCVCCIEVRVIRTPLALPQSLSLWIFSLPSWHLLTPWFPQQPVPRRSPVAFRRLSRPG